MTETVRFAPQEQDAENRRLAREVAADAPANTIEQVRDLLFGEAKREHDSRIAELDLSIKRMQGRIAEQLSAMETRMEAMSQTLSSRHEESLRQIGEAIVSLGHQISALGRSDGRDRNGNA
ncbi:hypothetical protein [Hyphomicrobium sp.]|uniref:hypothetical protein n=1 Tax=Hyphomicrobium sp. TaxID=82 RepID=UPI0025C2AF59|nr:hypothetical protein [Hyphomicrobium sp.]